jgi:hypothetical protein
MYQITLYDNQGLTKPENGMARNSTKCDSRPRPWLRSQKAMYLQYPTTSEDTHAERQQAIKTLLLIPLPSWFETGEIHRAI